MLLHDMRISEQVIRIFFILFSKRSKAKAERTQSEGKTGKKSTRFFQTFADFNITRCYSANTL
jgi:hypothetical protein